MSNYIPIEKDMHCSHFCCSFNLSKCSCLGFNIEQSFFFGNDIRFMSTVIYHFGNSCAILVYIPNLQKAYLFLFFLHHLQVLCSRLLGYAGHPPEV